MTHSTGLIVSAGLAISIFVNVVQFAARWRRKNRRTMKLDKYACDARAWRDFAKVAYTGSVHLFGSGNLFLIFPAATLGHHALEMYLKAALIAEGAIVFDPRKLKHLEASVKLEAKDCTWDHNLVGLARQLARKRPDFDLGATLTTFLPLIQSKPLTLEQGFAIFDPFFSELRYPQELRKIKGVSEEEKQLLDELIQRLQPFLAKIS
jgi:hypothetical protein